MIDLNIGLMATTYVGSISLKYEKDPFSGCGEFDDNCLISLSHYSNLLLLFTDFLFLNYCGKLTSTRPKLNTTISMTMNNRSTMTLAWPMDKINSTPAIVINV